MVILQEFPAFPGGVRTGLEVAAAFVPPELTLILMWWSWIADRTAAHGTKGQRNALFCAALLATTSNAFFWALAAHNLLPGGHRIKPPDTLLLKGLACAMLSIMVALFGKGRRTVTLTVVAGTAALCFWALLIVVSGAGVL